MPTVKRAAIWLSEGMGVSPAAVTTAARIMREADTNLIPAGSRGKGQEAQADNNHIVNMVIAMAVADPITSAARMVRAYRQVVFPEPLAQILDDSVPKKMTILPGGSLGEGMDWLVDELARATTGVVREKFEKILVRLRVAEPGLATVQLGLDGKPELYDARDIDVGSPNPAARLWRTAELTIDHFDLMAAIWADTLAHRARVLARKGSPPGGASPDVTTAASLAGEAAALSDQPAETELDGSTQTRPTDRRGIPQSSLVLRSGRSYPHTWSDSHGRYGEGGAYGAAA